ncbi:Amino acid permease-associated protein [Gloeomargarita lithophora Alchichica-D10]|uniref:Amino acid permease-associated protein n=1 Tax=Gloeomargarita lithophora Alchichica-D10 TaxID=1188229 RepID=A0A1J0AA33_9CYAN|nr:APC family permease [Gloeomargarita lithophora]APB32794.1 Amino acid permease-associated protein [Gloeomargarita lithophora Alchichica-D10]
MTATPPTLARSIGFPQLLLYGVGNILGAGIYGLVGRAAGQMGYAVWLGFLASTLAAGLTGLTYACLGSRYPRAAGEAYVIGRGFGWPWLAYGVGLMVLASGMTSMATAARVFAGYLHGLVGGGSLNVFVLLFLVALSLLVAWGIDQSLWANALCTTVEVVGLLLVILVTLPFWGTVNYLDPTPATHLSLPLVLNGAVLTFFAFIGFEDLLNVAEEVKSPERNLPWALLLAVVASSLVYVAVGVGAVSVVAPATLATSEQPLTTVMHQAAPWFPSRGFSLIALFAVANTALLNGIMGSRLVYGMATQGLLPRFLGRIHPQRRTPQTAVAVVGGLVILLALTGDISRLARATSILLLTNFLLMNGSLIRLQNRPGEPVGAFEIPRWVPWAGSLVCLAILSQSQPGELGLAGIILGVIAILYLVLRPSLEPE